MTHTAKRPPATHAAARHAARAERAARRAAFAAYRAKRGQMPTPHTAASK